MNIKNNICKELPSTEFLNSLLSYEPDTGRLIWKKAIRGCKANGEAGTYAKKLNGSRHCIRVRLCWDGIERSLVAHRIIWKMLGMEVPDRMVIDHIDRNPWNNKISNLRLATHSQNSANSSLGLKNKRNPELPRGIDWHPRLNKYRVQIMSNGKKRHIGVFSDLELAKTAWLEQADKEFGPEFTVPYK